MTTVVDRPAEMMAALDQQHQQLVDAHQMPQAHRSRAERRTMRGHPKDCAHALWTEGCRSCAEWAVTSGLEFAAAPAKVEQYADTDTLVLTGPELAAYRALQAAAKAAHDAQQAMATTGAALREAIQGLCATIAPGSKP